jgi:hypothetical protein
MIAADLPAMDGCPAHAVRIGNASGNGEVTIIAFRLDDERLPNACACMPSAICPQSVRTVADDLRMRWCSAARGLVLIQLRPAPVLPIAPARKPGNNPLGSSRARRVLAACWQHPSSIHRQRLLSVR